MRRGCIEINLQLGRGLVILDKPVWCSQLTRGPKGGIQQKKPEIYNNLSRLVVPS